MTGMGALLVTVFLFFVSAVAVAAESGACREVRLDAPGGSMAHVPVGSQGHVGICYAHAAGQMLDAFRFSHPAPEGDADYDHITAPLDLAAGFMKEDDAKSDFDDGAYHICPVAKYGIKTGTCSEERVRQLYWKGERKNFTLKLWRAHKAFQEYLKAHSDLHNWDDIANAYRAQACSDIGFLGGLASPAGKSLLPGPDVLMRALKNENYTDAMVDVLKVACDTPPRHPVNKTVHCEPVPLGSPDKMELVHNMLLKKGAQPIALKTCSDIMEVGRKYRGLNPDGSFKKDCNKHFLLVIGQKEINGKCRFLIRNSWGTDNDGYSDDWNPQEHGNMWIDEEAMAANTNEMCTLTDESAK